MKKRAVFSLLVGVIFCVVYISYIALSPMSLRGMQDVAEWKFSKYCEESGVCQHYGEPRMEQSNEGSATFFWRAETVSEPDIFITVYARGGDANLYKNEKMSK